MITKAEKVNANEIKITRQREQPPVPTPEVNSYERGYIEKQKIEILARKAQYANEKMAQIEANNVQRDIELAEVNEILAEMDKLGIVVKPIVVEPK